MAPDDFFTALSFFIYILGVLAAFDALFLTRSSQSAIAWVITLLLIPYLALPAYLLFSRPKLRNFKKAKHRIKNPVREQSGGGEASIGTPQFADLQRTLENLCERSFTVGNNVSLFCEGNLYFDALIADIEGAEHHIYLSSYIVQSDEVGLKVKDALIAAVQRGVEVYFLYDRIGAFNLKASYLESLYAAKVRVVEFNCKGGLFNLKYLNCRNHRKIATFDHKIGYVGGYNIAAEYIKRLSSLGIWRDTQIRFEGPEVLNLENIFIQDWNRVASEEKDKLVEKLPTHEPASGSSNMITIATGCSDERDECILFFLSLINSASKRLWIASPYFIPDDSIIQALNLAAVRGVDVRLLVPTRTDSIATQLASQFYFPLVSKCGVIIYKYKNRFTHQKVALVDDEISVVGSANLDNRSLRLSFEIMTVVQDPKFTQEVAEMFEEDFRNSSLHMKMKFEHLHIAKRIGANIARLFSPVL